MYPLFAFQVPMTQTQCMDGESTWVRTVSLPTGVPVEYKYVLRNKLHVTHWETIMGNRTIIPGVANVSMYVCIIF